jgi:predicted phosphodiesterase
VPDEVMLAGDWHGNPGWACHVIREAARLLADQPVKIILHAGDFGIWPSRHFYLDAVNDLLVELGIELWFVDGNHEDHYTLASLRETAQTYGIGVPGKVKVESNISWLTRGHRWQWHGNVWLALGGAVSVDRNRRTEGVSWWPQEAISPEDEALAIEGGRADVMLTHDAPSSVQLRLDPWPSFWDIADKARAEAHRETLQRVVDKVQPDLLIHGHYHRRIRQYLGSPSLLDVWGLGTDGEDDNYTMIDTRTLREIEP